LDGLLHKLKPLIFNPGKITTKEKEYSKALFQRKGWANISPSWLFTGIRDTLATNNTDFYFTNTCLYIL